MAGKPGQPINERLEEFAASPNVPVGLAWCALSLAEAHTVLESRLDYAGFRQRRVRDAEYEMWKRFVYPTLAEESGTEPQAG